MEYTDQKGIKHYRTLNKEGKTMDWEVIKIPTEKEIEKNEKRKCIEKAREILKND